MVFPGAGGSARHPSQLYEASLEGIVLFGLCYWLIHTRDAFRRPGLVAGVFTAGYGLARSFCELFREPDYQHWATSGLFTAGILYSLPMIAAGLYLVNYARTKPEIA
jgi:phosphatidylglycerol---prolipoprotein diacylglyceryl transferase